MQAHICLLNPHTRCPHLYWPSDIVENKCFGVPSKLPCHFLKNYIKSPSERSQRALWSAKLSGLPCSLDAMVLPAGFTAKGHQSLALVPNALAFGPRDFTALRLRLLRRLLYQRHCQQSLKAESEQLTPTQGAAAAPQQAQKALSCS
jgi:hypothetical protein